MPLNGNCFCRFPARMVLDERQKRTHACFCRHLSDSGRWDPRYWGYFITFNQGRYFEAHDVLVSVWLECRKQKLDTLSQGPYPAVRGVRASPKYVSGRPVPGWIYPRGIPMLTGPCWLTLASSVHALLDQWRVRIAGLESLTPTKYLPPRLLMLEQGLDV